ncbi:MAG: hypothetical protein JST32_02310 [Bacteroidetes bacterium]|nr:hypothetical protein [Bacteroidota bacterium]
MKKHMHIILPAILISLSIAACRGPKTNLGSDSSRDHISSDTTGNGNSLLRDTAHQDTTLHKDTVRHK